MADSTASSIDPADFVRGESYARQGYPHEAWTALRRGDPVHRCEIRGFDPFWAITKYEDVDRISRQPRLFLNSPRLTIYPSSLPRRPEETTRSILTMDPPEHGRHRGMVNRRFTPHGLSSLRPHVEELSARIVADVARGVVDGVAGKGECDFVDQIAARLPLAVIVELLGLPRDSADLVFRWSNELAGSSDPEYRGGRKPTETALDAQREIFAYFAKHLADRRREPRDDLLSILAHGEVEGRKLADPEILAYCFLLAVAGNETTRNATSGGMLALLDHPSQLARLRSDASLLPAAVEEILRWTSPVIHFCRTAAEDTELRGKSIRKGDVLALFYPSANRDEEVFSDPFRFDVGRSPNDHMAFGVGEHFCLGANLARMELQAIFAEILRRLDEVELAAPIERLRSSFVGGIKHMPVRFRVVAA